MATISRPKCRSKHIPCPAGDRCPEHRGMVAALVQAANENNFDGFAELKEESSSREEEQAREAFFAQATIKKNRKGEMVVTLPPESKEIYRKQDSLGHKTLTVTTKHAKKVVLPAVHPSELVDKTRAIRTGTAGIFGVMHVDSKKNGYVQMQEAISETYDGNVEASWNHVSGDITIDDVQVADDYKNRGVEAHVVSSIIVNERMDLYDFYGSENMSAETAKATGFEPNPYYWAGKTEPSTGITYPSKENLNKLNGTAKKPNPNSYHYSGLYGARYREDYPWMRLKYGKRISDMPLTVEPKFSREQAQEFAKKADARWNRDEKAKGTRTITDLS